MKKLQNERDFVELAESSKIISGEFLFLDKEEDLLMDRSYKDLIVENCTIQGGDFCSSNFINCNFSNVQFRDTALVGLIFQDCSFKKCEFHNIDPSFTLENCNVKSLSITTIHEPTES